MGVQSCGIDVSEEIEWCILCLGWMYGLVMMMRVIEMLGW